MAAKTSPCVSMTVEVLAGATLPKVIQAMITVARRNDCAVSASWESVPFVVSPEDTYQGVQRRVQKQLAAPKGKR